MTQIEKREGSAASPAWLHRWFDDFPSPRWWPESLRSRLMEGTEPLKVEEYLERDALVVKAEMPGIDPDKDVEIDVSDHTLHLRAERRRETTTEDKGGYHSEFQYGSFSRTVPLPGGATDKEVKATYKDGILEVRVPIDQGKAQAHKIPIERG